MGIAITLKEYLTSHQLNFEVIDHPRTKSTLESAEAAHIPGDQMVKTILLGDDDSYLMAVIPATHRLEIDRLGNLLGRDLRLMAEDEVVDAFTDCEPGSIPPLGTSYGMDAVVDISLMQQPEIYFESGDHGELIHMRRRDFSALMGDAPAYRISYHL